MNTSRLKTSVTTRILVYFSGGFFLLLIGLSLMELNEANRIFQPQLTAQAALATRNLQASLISLGKNASDDEIRNALNTCLRIPWIIAVRTQSSYQPSILVGSLTSLNQRTFVHWSLNEYGSISGNEVSLDGITCIWAPTSITDQRLNLEVYVDGQLAFNTIQGGIIQHLASEWIMLGVLLLIGLVLLRRWISEPLSYIVNMVDHHAGPEMFYAFTSNVKNEFSQLSQAIGTMLSNNEQITERLRKRERAFEKLYQFAPAAMISMDPEGEIIETNQRAVELLHCKDANELIGRKINDFIWEEDHGLLRQTVDRLGLIHVPRCEIRLKVSQQTIHAAVECVGVHDNNGVLQRVHLSLTDISVSRKLQCELEDKTYLLNLLIDHMSDAILLVDAQGRIAACNQQICQLLHLRSDSLIGKKYDPQSLWEHLSITDSDLFYDQLNKIEADYNHAAQEQFELANGTFQFQGIPVKGTDGLVIGRLWVVQDVTAQVQSQQLLTQQTKQLQIIKQMGQGLVSVNTTNQLLEQTAKKLHEMMSIEVVGVALRGQTELVRSHQVVCGVGGSHRLDHNDELKHAVETSLMPQILAQNDASFWPDLPKAMPWAKTFSRTGITSLVGATLVGHGDAQGIIWIARSGGEPIDSNHIYLLEAIVPLVAARIEFIAISHRLKVMALYDTETDLPNREQLVREIGIRLKESNRNWVVVALKVSDFEYIAHNTTPEKTVQLLCDVGKNVRRVIRRSCIIARVGDADFALICQADSVAHASSLIKRVEEIVKQMAIPILGEIHYLNTKVAAISPHDHTHATAEELLRNLLEKLEKTEATSIHDAN